MSPLKVTGAKKDHPSFSGRMVFSVRLAGGERLSSQLLLGISQARKFKLAARTLGFLFHLPITYLDALCVIGIEYSTIGSDLTMYLTTSK